MNAGRIRRALVSLAMLLAGFTIPAAAQQTGVVEGTVTAGDAMQALSGVRVTVVGTRLGAFTDESGRYRLVGVRAGDVEIAAEYIGRRVARRTVTVAAGVTVRADFELDVQAIPADGIVVTASREASRLSETAATVGVITESTIEQVKPSHPSEIMNRVPGVWVNVTGGEGHMTAIRQPLTTNPVYLYAEDGVPTRSTGFFNHNALYEIDVPEARRIEVVKGPATALYGSDAIGGTINVVTRAPSDGVKVSAEGGSWGFGRILASAGAVRANDGYLAELNLTRTDGWRDGTAYDRQSGTIRYDHDFGGSSLRTVATFSRIDQNTAGSSAISADDYAGQPQVNYTPISFRKIKALRLHSEYERLGERSSFTLTPYARWNQMDILPNWSLTYDPGVWDTGHSSLGTLVRYRRDIESLRTRLIAGADFDYSPGHHFEKQIQPTRVDGIFVSYEDGATIYDYDVTFATASPYLQAEVSPASRLRITAGVRFDAMRYDYSNTLGEETTGRYRRPASTTVDFTHVSPKLGATLALSQSVNIYGAYSHGFRAPSEGQLFRQGRADNTVGLNPVKADNVEAGVRIRSRGGVSFDVAVYRMTKTDDILTLTNTDGSTQTANAGETLHRGVELAAGVPLLGDRLRADVSFSVADHTYEDWRPTATVDYSGNEMEDAPRQLGHASLTWQPTFLAGMVVAGDWQRVGRYWMDADNTHRYPGHDLFGLRLSVPVYSRTTLFARLTNLTDERYAESSGYTVARGEEFAPGLPRAFYVGIQIQ